jgi:hypothetical protein
MQFLAVGGGRPLLMDEEAVVQKLEEIWRARPMRDPLEQLAMWRQRENDVEHRLSVPTPIAQGLLVAFCRQYGIDLYRRPRQRLSMMCVRAPAGFIREVWPLFERMAAVTEEAAQQAMARVIERWSRSADEASRSIDPSG